MEKLPTLAVGSSTLIPVRALRVVGQSVQFRLVHLSIQIGKFPRDPEPPVPSS